MSGKNSRMMSSGLKLKREYTEYEWTQRKINEASESASQAKFMAQTVAELVKFHLELSRIQMRWITVSDIVGYACDLAYQNFIKTLDNQEKWDDYQSAQFFAVLAVVSTGALGLLFNSVKFKVNKTWDIVWDQTDDFKKALESVRYVPKWDLKSINELAGPNLQATLTAAIAKTTDVLAVTPRGPAEDKIPHPSEYKTKIKEYLGARFDANLNLVSVLISQVNDAPFGSFGSKQSQFVANLLRFYSGVLKNPIFAPPDTIDKNALAKELEIGMWAARITSIGNDLNAAMNSTDVGRIAKAWTDVKAGPIIVRELTRLGIFSQANITLSSGETYVMENYYVGLTGHWFSLYLWAKNWEPSNQFGWES